MEKTTQKCKLYLEEPIVKLIHEMGLQNGVATAQSNTYSFDL